MLPLLENRLSCILSFSLAGCTTSCMGCLEVPKHKLIDWARAGISAADAAV